MPIEWTHRVWGDVATLEYGRSLRGYRDGHGSYQVFGTNGPIGWHDEALCEQSGVVIGRKGAYRGVHYSSCPFFVIDTAFYLKPKTTLDMHWAYYELLTHDINAMDSGSAIPSTSREDFYQLPILLPPLPEQQAIAHILGTLDDKIELNRRMNETLEGIARALFQSWFVDFDPVRAKAEGRQPVGMDAETAALFPDSFQQSEFGLIPAGWRVSTISDEFKLVMGQSPPGDTYNEEGIGLPFYQGRVDFGFRFPSHRIYCSAPTRRAKIFDTLVSVRAPVGDLNMASEECAIGRGVAALRHSSGAKSYTYHFMQQFRASLDLFNGEGTVFGSIGRRDFERLPVIAPPNSIVSAFEAMISPFDDSVGLSHQETLTLTELRDTLLPKLISGELRVPDADKLLANQSV